MSPSNISFQCLPMSPHISFQSICLSSSTGLLLVSPRISLKCFSFEIYLGIMFNALLPLTMFQYYFHYLPLVLPPQYLQMDLCVSFQYQHSLRSNSTSIITASIATALSPSASMCLFLIPPLTRYQSPCSNSISTISYLSPCSNSISTICHLSPCSNCISTIYHLSPCSNSNSTIYPLSPCAHVPIVIPLFILSHHVPMFQ